MGNQDIVQKLIGNCSIVCNKLFDWNCVEKQNWKTRTGLSCFKLMILTKWLHCIMYCKMWLKISNVSKEFQFLRISFFFPKVHAAVPRLVLHLHDEDISVRQACRVISYYIIGSSETGTFLWTFGIILFLNVLIDRIPWSGFAHWWKLKDCLAH